LRCSCMGTRPDRVFSKASPWLGRCGSAAGLRGASRFSEVTRLGWVRN